MDDSKNSFVERAALVLSFGGKFPVKEAGALLLTLAAALGLWAFVAAGYEQTAIDEISRSLGTINAYKTRQVYDWLNEHDREAVQFSRNPFLAEIVMLELAKPGSRRAQLEAWLKNHARQSHNTSMAFLSPKGGVIAATPGRAAGTEKEFTAAFARAAETGRALLTDLYLAADGRPRLTMFSPLSAGGDGGKTLCVLTADIDLDADFYPLLKEAPLFLKSTETLLVRREGDKVLYLNELDHIRGSALRFTRPAADARLPAAAALGGRTGFFEGVDYRGVEVFSAIDYLRGLNWAMITEMDRKAALAPAKTRARLALALILLAAGLIYGVFRLALSYRERAGREIIREGERRLAALFSNLPGVAYRSFRPGNWTIEFLSEGCLALTGYKPEELLTGKAPGFFDLIVPEDRERVRQILQAEPKVNNRYELTYSLKCRDGALKTVWEQGLAVKGQDGKTAALEGFISDITPLRRAEAGLRVSEQIFHEFMEHSPIYVFFKDENLRPIHLSRNYEAMLGRPLQELLGRTMDELFPSDLAKSMIADDLRILKEGKDVSVEEELNGRSYRTIKFPITLEGRPAYLAGYTIDVTEQKQAEEALRRQVSLQTLLLNISSSFLNFQPEGLDPSIQASLGEIAEFFGADRAYVFNYDFQRQTATNTYEWCGAGIAPQIGELQALPLARIPDWDVPAHRRGEAVFVPDSAALPPGALREIFESGGIKSVLGVPIMSAGGCEGFVGLDWVKRYHVLSGREQDLLALFGLMLANVCRRRLAEEALRESEDLYRNLFEGIGDAVFVHGLTVDGLLGKFIAVNDIVCRRLGYTRSELLGMTVLDTVAPESTVDKRMIVERLKRGERVLFEQLNVAKDGRRIPVEINSRSLTLNGEIAILSVSRDITERRLAERAREKLSRDLQEKNREMENFLYITTHDLRSPLVNIQGFSQNLLRYLEELKEKLAPARLPQAEKDGLEKLAGEQMPGALNFVLESSHKMDALITALLKVARIGRLEMKPETLDMTALVKKILVTLRYQLEQAGGEVTVHLLPPCKADPGAVSQLFTNLLDNAIKYRHKDRALAVNVAGEVRGDRIIYTVADNGAGIPAGELHRIWEVFYRPETAPGKKGEGIGLPMVKRLIEKNDGSVRAESREGEGAVFYIELPVGGLQNEG